MALRAERRRLREGIRAKRSLLKGRSAFEKVDARRKFKDAVARDRANRAHQDALARADRDKQQKQQSVAAQLRAFDSDQQNSEARELQLLRRQFVDAALRRAHLSVKDLNGLGAGLINDLAARGIRTAADFTGISRGPAPNGKGGVVIWIHTSGGRKVHVNGIGEHRAKALVEWRKSYVARAEERGPKRIGLADRRRIEELAKQRRAELKAEETAAEAAANETRSEARATLDETLARLAKAARDADREAAAKRAQYDFLAKELARLEAELEPLDAAYGGFRFRRRTHNRTARTEPSSATTVLRQRPSFTPPAPVSLEKKSPETGPQATVKRPGLLWLIPIVFYFGSALTGTPVLVEAPMWAVAFLRVGHLVAASYLFGHWIRRRRQWKEQRATSLMPAISIHIVWVWLIVAVVLGAQYD
ncbi:hypothetical protein J7E87_23555 [Streptomyces sp. ISL-1]|uniref:hypothetical protein n=1 Tax=Streptomyces sp. ISL-1 TaxID=2817657 RepID=UPI001BE9B1C9|nr:hypothetical protein [Streptomyces sp. ISL-1]MBT2392315.1 hypothetical protein [Streptomyces sp. ISL-1]